VLVAASDRTFGDSRMRSAVALERTFRAHVVRRDRLVFDTRFSAPAVSGEGFTLYALLQGTLEISGEPPRHGPCAYLLAPHEFERVAPTATTFRTWGDPCVSLDLWMATAAPPPRLGLAHGPIELPSAAWDALRVLASDLGSSAPPVASLRALFDALVAGGLVEPELVACQDDPPSVERLWEALSGLYARQAASAGLLELRRLTGRSLRQLLRDTRQLSQLYCVPGSGVRDSFRILRLRTAVLLLSSPGTTATDVARGVGYRSLEAMGRAFRDAGLPPPSAIMEHVRFRDPPRE
jgi:AraC-like DNA-binding protein